MNKTHDKSESQKDSNLQTKTPFVFKRIASQKPTIPPNKLIGQTINQDDLEEQEYRDNDKKRFEAYEEETLQQSIKELKNQVTDKLIIFQINRLKDVNLDDILQKYSEQSLKLSNLSMTKYNSLLNNRGDKIIPVLPEIQIEIQSQIVKINKRTSKYDTSQKEIFSRKNEPFLSQTELNHLNEKMMRNMMSSPDISRKMNISLFSDRSHRLPQVGAYNIYPNKEEIMAKSAIDPNDQNNLSESLKRRSIISSYSFQDILKFQLKHNQDQIKQIVKVQKQKLEEETNQYLTKINKSISLVKNMPKIRVAPSLRQNQRARMEGSFSQNRTENQGDEVQAKDDNQIQDFLEKEKQKELNKLKQVQDAKMKQQLSFMVNHKVYWYEMEQQKVKPDMREHTGLEFVNGKLYLYGGLSHKILSDFYMLDPVIQFRWRKLNVEEPTYGRHQHLMFSARRLLIIFGGEKYYDSKTLQRKCLNDIKIFNTDTSEMKVFKDLSDGITPRRAAAGTVVGRNLLVHGGINTNGQYLNDMWSFDLYSYKWQTIEVSLDSQIYKKGVAFHKGCAVISPDKKNTIQMYKKEAKEKTMDEEQDWIKEEGIYFFGGQDSKFEPMQEVYILKFDQRPMQWIVPELKGQPPIARYDHSMIYNDLLGLLVVYGGRNDNLPGNSCFLGDISILNVTVNCWCSLVTNGIPRPPRSGHSASQLNKKMVVYGGYNHNGFFNSDIQVLELDSTMAKKVFEQETDLQHRIEQNSLPAEKKKGQKESSKVVTQVNIMNIEEERNKFLEKVESQKKEHEELIKQIDESKIKNMNTFLPQPKIKYNEQLTWIAIKRQVSIQILGQKKAALALQEKPKPKKKNIHLVYKNND